jgi:hypothetical protein
MPGFRAGIHGFFRAATIGADSGRPDGYMDSARPVRAFGVGRIFGNDWIDTIKRRPRRPPQAAFVSLLAPRHS